MSLGFFDLGLGEEDELAMREARRRPIVVDREAALRLISGAGAQVDAAVRRRPLFWGAPFTLPGHAEEPPPTGEGSDVSVRTGGLRGPD